MHKFPANTLFEDKQFIKVASCQSTNAYASALLANNDLNEGTIVITPNQFAGRGQRGNVWEAEPHKNLTFSWVLKPSFLNLTKQFWLNAAVSLGITDFLTRYVRHGIRIKWPNDIYYLDNKIGGILIENSVRSKQIENAIVGIGLNINQTQFDSQKAISLHTICGHPLDLDQLLTILVSDLENRYIELKNDGLEKIREEYLDVLYWINQEHVFKTNKFEKGTIKYVDEIGQLVLEIGTNERKFNFKEIEFIQ